MSKMARNDHQENNSKWIFEKNIDEFERPYRVNFINGLSGFKSAHLVATNGDNGVDNLAIFSSVFHLGADPALMGMIIRPDSVERHTLANIRSSGYYSLNHVHKDIYQQAHQTSARYPAEVSEFEAVGLTAERLDASALKNVRQASINIPFNKVPFVKEAFVKVLLGLDDIVPIKANGTLLVIGKVLAVNLPVESLNRQGVINYQSLNEVAVVGLDNYYQARQIGRLSYAKQDKELSMI